MPSSAVISDSSGNKFDRRRSVGNSCRLPWRISSAHLRRELRQRLAHYDYLDQCTDRVQPLGVLSDADCEVAHLYGIRPANLSALMHMADGSLALSALRHSLQPDVTIDCPARVYPYTRTPSLPFLEDCQWPELRNYFVHRCHLGLEGRSCGNLDNRPSARAVRSSVGHLSDVTAFPGWRRALVYQPRAMRTGRAPAAGLPGQSQQGHHSGGYRVRAPLRQSSQG